MADPVTACHEIPAKGKKLFSDPVGKTTLKRLSLLSLHSLSILKKEPNCRSPQLTTLFFDHPTLEQLCLQSFYQATGRKTLLAKTQNLIQSPYRLLIQIGLLGPAFGGQCVLDFPLLTALNLCALQMSGKSFLSLSQLNTLEAQHMIGQLVGLPESATPETHRCYDPWVKRIDINLGPLFQHELMRVAIVEQQNTPKALRVQIGPEKEQVLPLDAMRSARLNLENRIFIFEVIDSLSLRLRIDESALTLGSVPPETGDEHILIDVNGTEKLVKSGSALVKSSLLEIANQVAPALIPEHLTGDISTPKLVPLRATHLNLPGMTKYQLHLVLMGAGPVRIVLELGQLNRFSPGQIDILKRLFNYTFYHPELKKIFGS